MGLSVGVGSCEVASEVGVEPGSLDSHVGDVTAGSVLSVVVSVAVGVGQLSSVGVGVAPSPESANAVCVNGLEKAAIKRKTAAVMRSSRLRSHLDWRRVLMAVFARVER